MKRLRFHKKDKVPAGKRSSGQRPHHRKRKAVRTGLILLLLTAAVTAWSVYRNYNENPGIALRHTLKAAKCGVHSISLYWAPVRNTDFYTVLYRRSKDRGAEWTELRVEAKNLGAGEARASSPGEGGAAVRVTGLEEGTAYLFSVRADNSLNTGLKTRAKTFSTKTRQKLAVFRDITKLTSSKPFRLKPKSRTVLSYSSSDEAVARVSSRGKVTVTGPGSAEITVRAEADDSYTGAKTSVRINVIESEPVSASGAAPHIIYSLTTDNCEPVKTVRGEGSVHVPQGIGYSGDRYYISYGDSGAQRIIAFDTDGEGRTVSVPKIDLGHPNGFTYADSTGLCYCVRGWSSEAVTYDPETGEYDTLTLPYGASGIAYDRARQLLYTCSRTAMISYSCRSREDYRTENRVGVVKHTEHMYTQDCGGHAGIMMRCLSGANKHGTNYIDLYDMIHGNYLGTVSCELSEVESCFADRDGYMNILANNSSREDIIWRTPLNIEDLGEGL